MAKSAVERNADYMKRLRTKARAWEEMEKTFTPLHGWEAQRDNALEILAIINHGYIEACKIAADQ